MWVWVWVSESASAVRGQAVGNWSLHFCRVGSWVSGSAASTFAKPSRPDICNSRSLESWRTVQLLAGLGCRVPVFCKYGIRCAL